MAIVPNDTRFIGINPTVDLRERRSARINRETQPHTMQDITDSIRPYKVLTAIITAYDNDAPIIVELENTIGTIDFYKEEGRDGIYRIESPNLFTVNKTILFYGSIGKDGDSQSDLKLLSTWSDASRIVLATFINGTESNFVIWQTPIEIRVYN
jgi:hypothetical protein